MKLRKYSLSLCMNKEKLKRRLIDKYGNMARAAEVINISYGNIKFAFSETGSENMIRKVRDAVRDIPNRRLPFEWDDSVSFAVRREIDAQYGSPTKFIEINKDFSKSFISQARNNGIKKIDGHSKRLLAILAISEFH